jgi:UDP-N-acetylmuramyl pentapeptide phosphotransferase/UDP-N-acetylglucosamine-1-phosphate transferase
MSVLVISFLTSFLFALLIVRYNHLHAHLTSDSDFSGVQKFHAISVPRVGGLAIFFGVLLSLCVQFFQNTEVGTFGLLLIVSALPVFIFGFAEDLTKKVGVRVRLLATIASAVLAGYLLSAWLHSIQIWGIDHLMLTYPFLVIAITCFAVGGVVNSFNIIDGYNGLSAMVAVLILSGITYVAFQVSDYSIMIAALAMIGGLMGFLVWNYPRGSIFLGDGGAYLIGFWIAELSVLLTVRNSEVSKWFPLLLCFYPIFETLFTIYRRIFLKRSNPGMPDAFHLHQLIYMRIVRWNVGSNDASINWQRNALTSPYLWALTIFSVVPAILFWRYHILLKIFTILFAVAYIYIYISIVRFKIPRWLRIYHNR